MSISVRLTYSVILGDDGAVKVADRLMKIADSVPVHLDRVDIESDGPEGRTGLRDTSFTIWF